MLSGRRTEKHPKNLHLQNFKLVFYLLSVKLLTHLRLALTYMSLQVFWNFINWIFVTEMLCPENQSKSH